MEDSTGSRKDSSKKALIDDVRDLIARAKASFEAANKVLREAGSKTRKQAPVTHNEIEFMNHLRREGSAAEGTATSKTAIDKNTKYSAN